MGTFTKQHIRDTTTDIVVKFTGVVDAGGMSDAVNTTLIMSDLRGAYDTNNNLRAITGGTSLPFYSAAIRQVVAMVTTSPANASFSLTWKGSTSNVDAVVLPGGSGVLNLDLDEGLGPVRWNAVGQSGANTGELFVTANGVQFGAYTIVVMLRKDPQYFDRGALVDKYSFKNP